MGGLRREPLVGGRAPAASASSTGTATAAGTGASSTSTTSRRSASRTPRSSRSSTARSSSSWPTASWTGCASTTPTAWPTRPATCERLRERGAEHVWVEKILDTRRAPARLAGGGHGRLRVPQRRHGALRRPGRRGRDDLAVRRAHRRGLGLRRGRARRAGRAGDDDVRARGRPPARRSTTSPASPTRCPRCRSTGPTSSRGPAGSRPRTARRSRPPGMDERLARALLLEERGHDEFVVRFQQTSPPVTAKGVEDTAFYRYLRLLALNEVGGDPARFGMSVEAFHAANEARALRAPRGLLVTQTHDTKRGGDVRARLGALASMPREWGERVRRWRVLTEELRRDGARGRAPDHQEQYLVFQTLVGRVADPGRAAGGLPREGAARAQGHDVVGRPRPRLGGARQGLRDRAADPPRLPGGLQPFAARVAEEGRRSALAQQLLKLTSPGRQRRLPGRRARGPEPRRPRQPPAGRLGPAALLAGRAAARRGARRAHAQAVPALEGPGPPAPAPGAVRGRLRPDRRRAGRVRLRPRAARCSPSRRCATPTGPGSPWAPASRGAGATSSPAPSTGWGRRPTSRRSSPPTASGCSSAPEPRGRARARGPRAPGAGRAGSACGCRARGRSAPAAAARPGGGRARRGMSLSSAAQATSAGRSNPRRRSAASRRTRRSRWRT